MAIHTSRHQQILPSIFSVRIHPGLLSRSQGSESWCHTALWLKKKNTKNNGYKKTISLYRYEWEQMMHKYDNIPRQLFPSLPPLPAFCIQDSKLSGTPRCMTYLTSGLLTPKPKADVAITRVISLADQFIRTDFLSALVVSSPVYAAVLISVCWLKDVARSIADFLQSTYMIVVALPISAATSSTSGCQ